MIDTYPHEPLRHGERDQPLRRLTRNAKLGRDLILRVAGDIIEPAGAGRVVQSRIRDVLPWRHSAARPSLLCL